LEGRPGRDRELTCHTKLDLMAFLDRSNIGNAQTAGMGEDLGFDDPHYQVGRLPALHRSGSPF